MKTSRKKNQSSSFRIKKPQQRIVITSDGMDLLLKQTFKPAKTGFLSKLNLNLATATK